MPYQVSHFVNGKTLLATGKVLNINNPATGEVAGNLYVADTEIINTTVAAANKAFITWSNTPLPQRAKILFNFKNLLNEHIKDIAELITKEHGKNSVEAMGSIQRGIDVVEYVCGIPSHLLGKFADNVATEMNCYSIRQPLGVCVGITPFNFPGMIPLWMFPMAIACGNTFILKPSEKDPSCSIKLAELAKAAGVPDGVFNVLQGDKTTVTQLITHPGVQAVSFVGSSAVAADVYQTAIAQHKRAQAFGGAKNHCVIMPDADIDQAMATIVPAAFGSAGERCMAISVVVVVGDKVADMFVKRLSSLLLAGIDVAPLITAQHLVRVESYIQLGIDEGAKLIIDGRKQHKNNKGFFIGASVFDAVTAKMRIYQEEIFGPVLAIVRVDSLAAALALVNTHDYGNGTAIFTRDGFTAREFATRVQVGMVGINVPVPVPVAYQSFGGWKNSIFADIGMNGEEAVRFYTKLKTVTERWSAKESS